MDVERNFRAQTYLPTGAQYETIKAVGSLTPGKRIYLITSGNGTGKTTTSINILLNIIYGNINIYRDITDLDTGDKISGFFDLPLYNKWPLNWPKSIWYVSNADSLKFIAKEFQNWINPQDTITTKEGKSSLPWSQMTFRSNEWDISLKTTKQEAETFESANVGIVLFDEPPPQKLFRAAVSRLRSGGIIVIPATPLFGAGWFVDEIIGKIDTDGDKWHQTVSVYTNCVEQAGWWDLGRWGVHPKGNLTKDNIEFTLRNYDVDELEARRDGVFKFLTGVVYKQYPKIREKVYIQVPKADFPKLYSYRMIIDPHDRRPPSVVWMRYDKYSRPSVVREWPSIFDDCYNHLPFHKIRSADPYTIKDFVRMWIEIEDELQIPPDRLKAIMDPNFGRKPNRVNGKMVYQEYQDEFRRQGRPRKFITEVIDDIATGHAAVKSKFLAPNNTGEIPLQIDKSCFNVDYSLRNYSYKELTGKQEENRELSEDLKELGKDFADLLRYAAVVPFKYRPPEGVDISGDGYEVIDYTGKHSRSELMRKISNARRSIIQPKGAAGV